MVRPFTHLHVASGYSLKYGTATPAELVGAAAELGMSALALTDRDGLYGAVKFALACREAGLSPILGVDLAQATPGRTAREPASGRPPGSVRRGPVRGGTDVGSRDPRVTVLALGADPRAGRPPGLGWSRLCHVVSAAHRYGGRGAPACTPGLVADRALPSGGEAPALAVLLGPDSEVGRAILRQDQAGARRALLRWTSVFPPGTVHLSVVHHSGAPGRPGSLGQAVRILTLARRTGIPAVLTNAVRYLTPGDAVTADVLDATRRLVPLDERHLDRVSAEGYLASGDRMAEIAQEIAEAAGDPGAAEQLQIETAALADRCRLDPDRDLGIGTVRFPEPQALGYSPDADLNTVLRARCEARIPAVGPGTSEERRHLLRTRLREELSVIAAMGYASYFLTVAQARDVIHGLGIRVAARGSGAGSLVNHLLGISGVDPIRHGLLMERFLSPLRTELPDIDLDVESHRRMEAYRAILESFGSDRVAAVSMTETYRVRQAVRDVGAALGLPPTEIDVIATSFPRLRARDVRRALDELPELAAVGLDPDRLGLLLDLVERLDGLPRHIALHPCGVILSDATLMDRTPVEPSGAGLPMSQFDKDDVDACGLVKLDVLGVRMQSAMSYALAEIVRVDGPDAAATGHHPASATDPGTGYLDSGTGRIDLDAVPLDDERTFALIRSTRTLGVFQIESPGQRELLGKFAPRTFADLIVDISLFRPGPVTTDMVTPFLMSRQGWTRPRHLHPRLEPILRETQGVVVFHEQVLRLIAATTGCTLAEADEARRALGDPRGRADTREWWWPLAEAEGYDVASRDRIWQVLEGFGAFGFCKAHAAAFALPTYQSAWLKAHHPAAFLAGVLTHDPGMYPKRLLLDEARNHGITVLPPDVNLSGADYRVERQPSGNSGPADGGEYGIRIALSEVKGITDEEITRIVRERPYRTLSDFWHRAATSRSITERLVVAGAFDSLYAFATDPTGSRTGRLTRRDLLLHLADLDRWTRTPRGALSRGSTPRGGTPAQSDQLLLELGAVPEPVLASGLPELTEAERVRAELDVLGLDVSHHVLDLFATMLDGLDVTRSRELLGRRNQADLLVAGVKVATQTPPVRSGRRVVFLTLDDSTGPVDIAFFDDVPGSSLATVFHSWLFLVRGVSRRTGPRGVSLRATGVWDLPSMWQLWNAEGPQLVRDLLRSGDVPPRPLVQRRPGGSVLDEMIFLERGREIVSGMSGLTGLFGSRPPAPVPDVPRRTALQSGGTPHRSTPPGGFHAGRLHPVPPLGTAQRSPDRDPDRGGLGRPGLLGRRTVGGPGPACLGYR